jgi:hypothetical protein
MSKSDFITLFNDALRLEIKAEEYSAKLMEAFKANGLKLELSSEINTEEKKHQNIVKQILTILQK